MTGPGWVEQQLGAQLHGDATLPQLVRLALRRNPRRAHLLVSTVLGKHLPADPLLVRRTGLELGRAVRSHLAGVEPVVLGFAETATGLGHVVAEALDARYLHSTRRLADGVSALVGFEEEHSHATAHLLLPEDPALLSDPRPFVLVDDELSTGRTALNTIRALHGLAPDRARYVIAALVDLRGAADRAAVHRAATELGVRLDVVALARGEARLPPDFTRRAAGLVAAPPQSPTVTRERGAGEVRFVTDVWPVGVRESGRHGFAPTDVRRATAAARAVAAAVRPELGASGPVLVLGTEELMYAPTLIAAALADDGVPVRVSTTTRSPVHVRDEPGYPIRSAIRFTGGAGAADGPGPRFAYNVAGFDEVVLVRDVDEPALVDALRRTCRRLHVVTLPVHTPTPPVLRGPAFGSYAGEDVGWLLTDLSAFALEAPTEEREEAIQSGGAHYAESLPVEYQPDAEYRALFERALDDSADRIAHAAGVVTEILLAERGAGVVLASLARAGTPVGVLLRRWARFAHGLELPHYAVSIVRGRGIDTVALRQLATAHDPADVVFVDGWTGKGAIARELGAAIGAVNAAWATAFDPALAVLADPGACARTFGTRDDFLVPSACLNSTVSGLVSRTVLNTAVLAPGQYHGAKFYRELLADDVSARFVDAVTRRFGDVAGRVAADWRAVRAGDRRVTWAGWSDVEQVAARYGIDDVTLVKPGVGETTRVLLRRVPWAVLVRSREDRDLAHVLLLAQRRGVPVLEQPDLTYSCVGLVHPGFTRGATGADGRAVARR